MQGRAISAHKSLRRLTLNPVCLAQGLGVFAVADALLLWQMQRVLMWHTRAVEWLLGLAKVPWEMGRELRLLPGISASLVHTGFLDYQTHPLYPVFFCVAALGFYGTGNRWWPAPVKPLLWLVPASLGVTLLYLQYVQPSFPYSPEDFCAMWIRSEAYLWLLLPGVFALSFFTLSVPLGLKISWLAALVLYAFVWSALRLALALATFHYFGPIWMPLFYFAFGILADFLYIVAFYSLAMDGAAAKLAEQRGAWE